MLPDAPLVVRAHDGKRHLVAAADQAALALGLRPGMKLAQAQAQLPGLVVQDADPEGDRQALGRMAAWCLRYAPLTAPNTPDGIWLDSTGCAHLHGGEAAMLDSLLTRLRGAGFTARAAIASTPGAAHALARFGNQAACIPGDADRDVAALAPLPVAALRLPASIVETLGRMGLDRIGQLLAAPRAPLARRFGAALLTRLDQATGRVPEPVEPVFPPGVIQSRLAFAEPLITMEAFATVLSRLTPRLCAALERAGQGARRLDLALERVDGTMQVLSVGAARPSRDAGHLGRMMRERLEQLDARPGEEVGVEAMRLVAAQTESLAWTQRDAALAEGDAAPDMSALVDRLSNRLGPGKVFRVEPVESDLPERCVRQVSALQASVLRGSDAGWPGELPRPVRLISPPQPVDALSMLPDQPPAAFTWRRVRRRVQRSDGPERVYGEWWRRDAEMGAVRDYWRVEDEAGRRYWLFRRGDGADPATGDLRWFIHGLF